MTYKLADTPALVARGLIRIYQLTVSPLLGPRCRYLPSCSEYAAEAIERHGAASGTWLALKRLARCHPWGGSGLDPVPDHLHGHGCGNAEEQAPHTSSFQSN